MNGEFVPETPHEPIRSTSDFWKDFFFPTTGKTIPKDKMITKKIDLKALDPAKDIVGLDGAFLFLYAASREKDTYRPDSRYLCCRFGL